MAALDEIIAFLDDLLDPGAFSDYGPNGLQVPGAEQVATVVTGVSAGTRAVRAGGRARTPISCSSTTACFWSGPPRPLDRAAKRRLQLLLRPRHEPRRLPPPARRPPRARQQRAARGRARLRALGAVRRRSAWSGRLPGRGHHARRARRAHARARRAGASRSPSPRAPSACAAIGIVSGGGSPYLADAIDAGLDAFLTGEPVERVMDQAQEAGIHFLAAGPLRDRDARCPAARRAARRAVRRGARLGRRAEPDLRRPPERG